MGGFLNNNFPWSDFDRASSLLCGNKMPTRCNRWYLLQILLHALHFSGNTMPIIRSSRVLYIWSLPVVFGALVFRLSVWCGAGGYVSGLVEFPWKVNCLLHYIILIIYIPYNINIIPRNVNYLQHKHYMLITYNTIKIIMPKNMAWICTAVRTSEFIYDWLITRRWR